MHGHKKSCFWGFKSLEYSRLNEPLTVCNNHMKLVFLYILIFFQFHFIYECLHVHRERLHFNKKNMYMPLYTF